MGESDYSLPLPVLEGLHGEFYEFCKKHTLFFQRCKDCDTWRHMPREMCAECGSWSWEWSPSTGRGRVYTWTVVARPMHPAFVNECPYAPVVVEMEEGVRLVSIVEDCTPEELEIDMEVEVLYDDVTDEITLPKFRRVAG